MNTALGGSPHPPRAEPAPFGELLRGYRLAAGLSQEALAERAGISVQAISALETGRRHAPYRDTVALLARALHLAAHDHAALEASVARTRAALPAAPLRVLPTRTPLHNLPAPTTALIGREHDVAHAVALLQRPQVRLLTLTGVGGVGKTRLALQVAGELLEQAPGFPDGAWLVELAALANPALVVSAVAAVLGLRESPGTPLLASLNEYLAAKQLLLVLDNCEHLIDACAQIACALLATCPRLRILATSREGLEVAGEVLYRVPSIAVPDLQHLPPVERVSEYAAVRLFIERAQARCLDFALTAWNSRAVSQICVRLDGIPLAIELAATRVGVLPVEGIAARLDDRFRLLTGGLRTALPRQQTLRATLDWSHELLSEPEQVLLRRLSVFAGGWTLEAAEAVCVGEEMRGDAVLGLLTTLVRQSLAVVGEQEGDARYRLLETVRQYGWERLATAGETEQVREHHLGWYLALAERSEPALTGPEQGEWLVRLESEHDNVRAALRWSSGEGGRPEAGLRLAGALYRFWEMRGHLGEGRSWLEAALIRARTAAPEIRARALNAAGRLACFQGDYTRARPLIEESLALCRDQVDGRGIALSLHNLGLVTRDQGDHERARILFEESLAIYREVGDRWGIAVSLSNLGQAAHAQTDYERAQALYEESLTVFRDSGDRRGNAHTLSNLGLVAAAKGDHERARILFEESLTIYRELGDRRGIPEILTDLGHVAGDQGDYERASALYAEGLALFRDLGDRLGIAYVLNDLAELAVVRKQPRRAARLFGATEALRASLGALLTPIERAAYEPAVAALRQALPERALDEAWAAGRALSLDQILAEAMETAVQV